MNYTILLNNIRSLLNVGALFRTADGAGFDRIYLTGITPHPPRKEISKTALGAEEFVSWEYYRDPLEIIKILKTQ
jgi:tRNA G18 (ribose-2'-O)-methylase SpoU